MRAEEVTEDFWDDSEEYAGYGRHGAAWLCVTDDQSGTCSARKFMRLISYAAFRRAPYAGVCRRKRSLYRHAFDCLGLYKRAGKTTTVE